MGRYDSNASQLRFAPPSMVLAILGAAIATVSAALYLTRVAIMSICKPFTSTVLISYARYVQIFSGVLMVFALLLFILAIAFALLQKDCDKICRYIKVALFLPQNGNPLHLKDGERLPKVSCKYTGNGMYAVTISAAAAGVEDIQRTALYISAGLTKKYSRYAVTEISVDAACNDVTFIIDDVLIDRTIYADSVSDLMTNEPTKLNVQKGTQIDLSTSGSMIVAGKTRSGKTTGIISLLLQILAAGRDLYGSEVLIVDPKQAELSRLPYVISLDADGEARSILAAMRRFADAVTSRQRVLNDISATSGDAVKWWDAGMSVSILFIDEFVSARSLFPAKANKDEPDYCLAEFDNLLKRIVTMGASAGCYVIISVAEASVEQGGIPAMIRAACSTRILFRPTMPEARLLWDSSKLETLTTRSFSAGEAWFSSTDGIHDGVSCVHFPLMRFPVYAELRRLLSEYYGNYDTAQPGETKAGGVSANKTEIA